MGIQYFEGLAGVMIWKPEEILRAGTMALFCGFVIWSYVSMWIGWKAVDFWVYRYQTLIGALLALGSLFYLARQVDLQRKQNLTTRQLALRNELDALAQASIYTLEESGFFRLHNEIVGAFELLDPSEGTREYVRRLTTPQIADTLDRLHVFADRFNDQVRRNNDLPVHDAHEMGKLRAAEAGLTRTKDQLSQLIEARRRHLDAFLKESNQEA